MLELTKTVREVAVEVPGAIQVFESLGIDYCCHGECSLKEACQEIGMTPDQIIPLLKSAATTALHQDWSALSLSELANHIVTHHHSFVRKELPRLENRLASVIAVHGVNHPELYRLQMLVERLRLELTTHMYKEEHILFPYIKTIEAAANRGLSVQKPPFESALNPVNTMRMEHEEAGKLLKDMRATTHNYAVPADRCFSYQTLYQDLRAFEDDMHQHIHLENNILFPKAIELEKQVLGSAAAVPQ